MYPMFNLIFTKMKKVFLMALLAVTSCFAMISCGDDKKDDPKPENNTENVSSSPFAGNTYKVVGEGRDEDDYFGFISDSKVSWGEDNVYNYTFDEKTFTLYRGATEVATVSYTFSEDKNTLTLSSSAGISGTYVKQ